VRRSERRRTWRRLERHGDITFRTGTQVSAGRHREGRGRDSPRGAECRATPNEEAAGTAGCRHTGNLWEPTEGIASPSRGGLPLNLSLALIARFIEVGADLEGKLEATTAPSSGTSTVILGNEAEVTNENL
jgi:hypothetical protein